MCFWIRSIKCFGIVYRCDIEHIMQYKIFVSSLSVAWCERIRSKKYFMFLFHMYNTIPQNITIRCRRSHIFLFIFVLFIYLFLLIIIIFFVFLFIFLRSSKYTLFIWQYEIFYTTNGFLMYFGCASVLQSIVTSVPAGAPTSWFGTNIIGETARKKQTRTHT